MSAEKHSPLDQFKIEPLIPFDIGGYNLSFTNSSLWMLIAVASVTLFMTIAMSKKALVPGRLQSLAELTHGFVGNIIKENVGAEDGKKFFPLIFTLFTFILFCNFLGMVPYSFTPTSHIIVTLSLALMVFLTVLLVGIFKHGFHFLGLFIPSGLPKVLVPIIFVIEIVSFMARPVSLTIRLAAAMTAGHILLKVFAGFVVSLMGFGAIGPVLGLALPMPLLVGMIGLEFFVCFLQAYIFALLTSIYLHDAIHLH